MTDHRELIGDSAAIAEVRDNVELVGPTRVSVLLIGETGTGKEIVARELHTLSGRDPFLAVNCAAVPESLLESELFGHAKGSFTGAVEDRTGLIEAADGGTLFLDEIGDMAPSLQTKLLRVLEEGSFRRVAANRERAVQVRVIAATNRALQHADVRRKLRFRDDLYFRLAITHLVLPPLRSRPEDVPTLAVHYCGGAGLSEEALRVLAAYPWPGNVRELKSVVEMAAIYSRGGEIRAEHLPERVRREVPLALLENLEEAKPGRGLLPLREAVADFERKYIEAVLEAEGGNKTRAAEVLDIDRRTLYRKLKTDLWGGET